MARDGPERTATQWVSEGRRRAVAALERTGATISRHGVPAAVAAGGIVWLVGPAVAQMCETNLGLMLTDIETGMGQLFVTFLVVSLLSAPILKMLPIPYTSKLGNAAIGAFFLGLFAVVAMFTFSDFVFQFIPLDPGDSCSGTLGG